jgi:hypothetical protein
MVDAPITVNEDIRTCQLYLTDEQKARLLQDTREIDPGAGVEFPVLPH